MKMQHLIMEGFCAGNEKLKYIVIWNTICKDKIEEAYNDFLKQVNIQNPYQPEEN